MECKQDARIASVGGGLFAVSGHAICCFNEGDTLPCHATYNDRDLTMDVGPEGKLLLALVLHESTDNREEAELNAVLNHQASLEGHLREVASLALDMRKLEEQAAEEDVTDENMEVLSQEIGRLGVLRGRLLGRIKRMEKTTELTVSYSSRMGSTAELQPGLATKVSFLDLPVVWCPTSLANEQASQEEKLSVVVPVCGVVVKGGKSEILSPKMLHSFFKMFHEKCTLSLLCSYSQTSIPGASVFDAAVKGKSKVLVVIKASTGNVFGVYEGGTYGSGSDWNLTHADTFLFALGSTGEPTEALKLIHSNSCLSHLRCCGIHVGQTPPALTFGCGFNTAHDPGHFKPAAGFTHVPYTPTSLTGANGAYKPVLVELFQVD